MKKNLNKGIIGFIVACLLFVFGTCGTAQAESIDGAIRHKADTRALNEIAWNIDKITPWILNYCNEGVSEHSTFLKERQIAWDILNNSEEATQQQIDEATESLRIAFLALGKTLYCKEEHVEDLRLELLRSRTYMDMYIFTGIPLPNHITAASYNRMRVAYETIGWAANNQSEPEELLSSVRTLQEAIASIEINNADYTALRAALLEEYDIKEVSWQYTPTSYERYANTCDLVYKEFGMIPTQEEADDMLSEVEAAKLALILRGDSDLNGSINVKDVLNIQKHIAKIIVLEDTALEASDINVDFQIDVCDIIILQKFLAGNNFINTTFNY